MNKTKFNFATVFSLMALLVYAFFAFMGLVYWKDGQFELPILITVGGIALILLCLFIMCTGKESRWKIGKIGEVLFGLIILLTFIVSAFPFTNFFKVVERQNEITVKIENLLKSAKSLDKAYDDYAESRIQKYEDQLKLVAQGKHVRPSEYEQLLANAAGDNDNQKIANLSKSLHRQLLPASKDSICAQRTEWLEKANQMSVWNMQLPANISKIASEVDNYVDNYTELSSTIRKGETCKPFTYTELSNDLGQLRDVYTKFSRPSIVSIIVSLIVCLIMLLPYLVAQKSLAGESSKQKQNYE